jgi:tetratricopeptide (TPR) repeat protein
MWVEGSNGRICVAEDSVKVDLYKQKMFTLPPSKWDRSKISKTYDIPRNTITDVKLVDILGSHQFQIYFPKAGFGGFVHIFISNEQREQAEEMIKALTRIEPPTEMLEHSDANSALEEGVQEHPNSISIDGVLLTAESTNGKVELLENVIRIHESYKSGTDTVKEVSIKDIKNVTLKKKGLTDGNISMEFPGSGPFGLKLIYFKEDHKQEFDQLASELMCRINPDKPEYGWNNKGIALEKQGKLDEAIQAFDKAIELNQNFALPWSNKALMLLRQEMYDEAIKAVDKALEIDPKLAAAQNVKKLITKKPDALNKNISKILQRRGISPNEVLIATEGANGQICLTEKGVLIGREGGLGTKILVGYTKGEKFLPYRNITSVQFKEPGMTWGYIQFTVPGGIENRGGAFDAGSDENTVTFRADKLEIFRKIRDIVEERQGLGTAPIPQIPPKSSIADELTKLAALKRDGAITEEEFEQLKKDLLSSRGK